MIVHIGKPPPQKSLSPADHKGIAELLKRNPEELVGFFAALDRIIAMHSLEAQPLVDPGRRRRVRDKLNQLRKLAAALSRALQDADPQVKKRLALGWGLTPPGNVKPQKDFPAYVLQFRNLVELIDDALTPPRGDRARTDHLRAVTYYCAVAYQELTGKLPAKQRGGALMAPLRIS